ncbi:MAG: hypothetical protein COB98_02715 [Flavobacteriaceae bacterium]|nr:MAG: hypothetical protein COB98_02715 [Flavobacteriaceae bacterium]
MNKRTSGIITAIAGVIALIGFYFFVRILMEGDETIETDAAVQAAIVDPFISFSLWTLGLIALVTVVMSLVSLVLNPTALKKALIAIVAMGIIFFISYSMANGDAVLDTFGTELEGGAAGSISKLSGTGIWFSIILGAIGLLGFAVDTVKSLIK